MPDSPVSPAAVPRRALLSVSDKTGLVPFAQRLASLGFELVSTGGTATTLRQAGLEVTDVAAITGFPEMLEGRVKTLHPKVHGGLLGRTEKTSHRAEMAEQGIAPIEVLVVNLYPFEAVAARARSEAGASFEELIENIDIGGPAMLRSAAKNFAAVAVVTDPGDYAVVAGELEQTGAVSAATRWRLARAAFARTAAYDGAIAATLGAVAQLGVAEIVHLPDTGIFPAVLQVEAPFAQSLRYGENPHQRAALYRDPAQSGGLAQASVLQGKEVSYNNFVDLEAAWELAWEFEAPSVAIIKHTNPAGCAVGADLAAAYARALECDPVSAFGGVIAVNRVLDETAAAAMATLFVECIAAPGFSPGARTRLAAKKNLRLVEVQPRKSTHDFTARSLSGGWLVQEADRDLFAVGGEPYHCVTQRAPSVVEARALEFAWRVAKHVKSNAIVFAREQQTVAVGAGQMSRVDAVKIAGIKAQLPLAGSVVASDAFFPFPDGIEEAARLGATAIIQPGGSVRDAEGIAACDRLGLAMVFTGTRHFRH